MPPALTTLRVGSPAPAFSGPCSDGARRSLDGFARGSLLLVFLRHLG